MSRPRLRILCAVTVVTIASLLVVFASVLWQSYPSTEAVRLRNALLFQIGSDTAFDWTPQNVPATFLLEQLPMPAAIESAAKSVVSADARSDDLARARLLAAHLNLHAVKGGGIQSLDVAEIYREIVEQGIGYCSDVVDAYIALAHAARLFVRPVAFSFDGFGGHGHINVEVFDQARGAWVMLDVFNNVVAVDSESRRPLSAKEFRALFRTDRTRVTFLPIAAGRQRIPIYSKLVDYYASGIDQWYLWNGNNVVSRTGAPLVRQAGWISEPLAELLAVWQGRVPSIIAIESGTNRAMLESMQTLRVRLLTLLYLAIGLTMLLVVQVWLLIEWSRRVPRSAPAAQCG